MMKNINVYIKESLISYHRNCSVDIYGQRGAMNVRLVFGENADMVLEHLKENRSNYKMIEVSTYGNGHFTFKGIGRILDEHLEAQCNKVFREENENYKRAMTSW
jgi:hypothetical protein